MAGMWYAVCSLAVVLMLCSDVHAQRSEKPQEALAVSLKTHIYKEIDGHKIALDVHRLKDDTKKRPVFLRLHGGALIGGGRYFPAKRRDRWLKAGFVVVSIDYRLAPQVKVKDQFQDIQDAYTWVIKNGPTLFDADVDHIVVGGGSAGGYLTLAAGSFLKPAPKALFSLSGYGDILWYLKPHYLTQKVPPREQIIKDLGEEVESNPRKARERSHLYISSRQKCDWIQLVTGLDPKTQSKELEAFRPILHVTQTYPPIVLVHAQRDHDVPYSESVNLAKVLTEKGVDHLFITLPGGGHCRMGSNAQQSAQTAAQVMKFLSKYVPVTGPAAEKSDGSDR